MVKEGLFDKAKELAMWVSGIRLSHEAGTDSAKALRQQRFGRLEEEKEPRGQCGCSEVSGR